MTKLASQKKKTTCVPKGKNNQSLKYKPKLKELRNQNMIAVIMKLTLTTLTKKVQLTHDVKLVTVQKQMTKQWELNGFGFNVIVGCTPIVYLQRQILKTPLFVQDIDVQNEF